MVKIVDPQVAPALGGGKRPTGMKKPNRRLRQWGKSPNH
jgi:hypothetical protein